jgi:hypothetical protein
VWFIFR